MEVSRINMNGPGSQTDINPNPKIDKSGGQARVIQNNKADVNIDVRMLDKADIGAEVNKSEKSAEDLKKAVEIANKALFKNNTHLKFEIHNKTKEVMVKIVNDVSGEVVKEIPPEKMLDMVAKLWEIAGILIDERR